MWHYLYFIVLVKVKDPTEYTGPESYVAQMITVSTASLASPNSQAVTIWQLRPLVSLSPLPSSWARNVLALSFCEPLNRPVSHWRISTLLTSSSSKQIWPWCIDSILLCSEELPVDVSDLWPLNPDPKATRDS